METFVKFVSPKEYFVKKPCYHLLEGFYIFDDEGDKWSLDDLPYGSYQIKSGEEAEKEIQDTLNQFVFEQGVTSLKQMADAFCKQHESLTGEKKEISIGVYSLN